MTPKTRDGAPVGSDDRENEHDRPRGVRPQVGLRSLALAFAAALAFVVLTRAPVARLGPVESDEFGYLETIGRYRLPMHHTLFLAAARVLGATAGGAYRGVLALDLLTSAGALTDLGWMLRAAVRPATAAAAAFAVAVSPVFWGYGAMAGNYTAVVLVGSVLLGIVARAWVLDEPETWHPYAAAAALALGAGYRQDIGTFWLPVFLLILARFRDRRAVGAFALFVALSLAWFVPMLVDVGGWTRYRTASAEFSREAGYKNSVFYLGVVDAPLRYVVKLGMALLWTLGPLLAFVPSGASRLARRPHGVWLAAAMLLAALPALGFHLVIHFGVPGYAFHYVPALVALAALGAERTRETAGVARLLGCAAVLAALFLFYPTDYQAPGARGNFDLSFARHTRAGLRAPLPEGGPSIWRTRNSRPAAAPGE